MTRHGITLRWRRAARLVATAAAVVCCLLAGAGTAAAHATLRDTDPEQSAVLPNAPERVTLTFNEPVRLPDGAVRLFDAEGNALPTQAHSVDNAVVVSLPARLENGTYVLSWRIVSVDSHPVSGALTFSVGEPSTQVSRLPQRSGGTVMPVLKAVLQALLYGGLFLSGGLALFVAVLLPPNPGLRRLRLRLRNTVIISGELAVLAAVLLLPVTAAYQRGATLSSLVTLAPWQAGLSSPHALMALLIAAGLGTAAAALHGDPARGTRRWVTLGGAGIALGSLAIVGHTRSYGPAALVITSDVAHVVAAAVWFGGLMGLAMSLSALGGEGRDAARTVSRFSTAAAATLATLVAAGSLLAWRILGSWTALVQTAFGWLLLGKISLVALTVAVAAYNRYRLVPRITAAQEEPAHATHRMLRKSVRAEAALIAGVLLLTGFLVDRSPELTPSPATAAEEAPPDRVSTTVGNVHVTATVDPATVGRNTITLRIKGVDGRAVDLYAEPVVTLRSPEAGLDLGTQQLSTTGPGTYRLRTIIPAPGTWKITVSLRLGEFRNPVVALTVTITE